MGATGNFLIFFFFTFSLVILSLYKRVLVFFYISKSFSSFFIEFQVVVTW